MAYLLRSWRWAEGTEILVGSEQSDPKWTSESGTPEPATWTWRIFWPHQGTWSCQDQNPFSLFFFSCLSPNSLILSPCLWLSLSQSLASSFWPAVYLLVRIHPHWLFQGCENSGVKTESKHPISILAWWDPETQETPTHILLGLWAQNSEKKILFFKNYWNAVDLQCCVNVCCIAKWLSYT